MVHQIKETPRPSSRDGHEIVCAPDESAAEHETHRGGEERARAVARGHFDCGRQERPVTRREHHPRREAERRVHDLCFLGTRQGGREDEHRRGAHRGEKPCEQRPKEPLYDAALARQHSSDLYKNCFRSIGHLCQHAIRIISTPGAPHRPPYMQSSHKSIPV